MQKSIILIAAFLIICVGKAQEYTIDPTFDPEYNFYALGSGGMLFDIYEEPDGSIWVAGDYSDMLYQRYNLVRFYENGDLDYSFISKYWIVYGEYIDYVEKHGNDYLYLHSG